MLCAITYVRTPKRFACESQPSCSRVNQTSGRSIKVHAKRKQRVGMLLSAKRHVGIAMAMAIDGLWLWQWPPQAAAGPAVPAQVQRTGRAQSKQLNVINM